MHNNKILEEEIQMQDSQILIQMEWVKVHTEMMKMMEMIWMMIQMEMMMKMTMVMTVDI